MTDQPREKDGRFASIPTNRPPSAAPGLPYKPEQAQWQLTIQRRRKSDGSIHSETESGPYQSRMELEGALLAEVNKYFHRGSEFYITAWVAHPARGLQFTDPMGFHAAGVIKNHPENLGNSSR